MPERDDQAPCDLALKEWAVAVLAYATGETICAVRKGGIHEKRFDLPGRRCFLFPTYLHQAAETVQPRFHPALEHVTANQPGGGVVHLRYLAEITDVLALDAPERLEALEPHLIWTPAYVTQRFRWRPRQPLQLLLLRVSQLPEEHVLPMLAAYNGCSSWVTLERPLSTAGAQPVMADARYGDVRQSVLEAVDAVTVT